MSASLRSYHKSDRLEVIRRRLSTGGEKGLGFWAALDALKAKHRTPDKVDLDISPSEAEALVVAVSG